MHSLLTQRRLERLRAAPVDTAEILQWLCKVRRVLDMLLVLSGCPRQWADWNGCIARLHQTKLAEWFCHAALLTSAHYYALQVQPVPREVDEALRAWTDKTPAMAAIKGTAEGSDTKQEGGGKKGKGEGKAKAGKKKK